MPEARLTRTRKSLPEGYQFGHSSTEARYGQYLSENITAQRFPFTPQGIADAVDDAVGRAVYENVFTAGRDLGDETR